MQKDNDYLLVPLSSVDPFCCWALQISIASTQLRFVFERELD